MEIIIAFSSPANPSPLRARAGVVIDAQCDTLRNIGRFNRFNLHLIHFPVGNEDQKWLAQLREE
jgi:hypothetical protein